jgi:hypothetical protein
MGLVQSGQFTQVGALLVLLLLLTVGQEQQPASWEK